MIANGAPVSAFAAAKVLQKIPLKPDKAESELESSGSESFEEEDGDGQAADPPPPREQLSTWTPKRRKGAAGSKDQLTLQMKHQQRATFSGVYDLRVEQGAVEVYGAVLCPSSGRRRVYAPTISALPQIVCKTRECKVIVYSCRNDLARLGQVSSLFSRVCAAKEPADEHRRSFSFLQWSDDVDPVSPFHLSREWLGIFEQLRSPEPGLRQSRPPSIFVCGTQKSGKSTFCRTLSNHVVTRHALRQLQDIDQSSSDDPFGTVLFLDLDPGQPEFTAPGQVSLWHVGAPILGPPFSHVTASASSSFKPIRIHTIANSTPQDDIEYYLSCARDLAAAARKTQERFPKSALIVNTPGWIAAQGLDVLVSLLALSRPTAAVLLGLETLRASKAEQDGTRAALRAAARPAPLLELSAPAAAGRAARRTPAELRTMQYAAYLHLRDGGSVTRAPPHSARRTPLVLPFDALITLAGLHDTPAAPFVAPWIERSVVAVCVAESAAAAAQLAAASRATPAEGLTFVARARPDPRGVRTLGLAYVREVDTGAGSIVLVTPVAAAVRALVEQSAPEGVPRLFLTAGRFETPYWAYAEDLAWEKRVCQRARETADVDLDGERLYVKRLRPGERADLVWRAGATARFGRRSGMGA